MSLFKSGDKIASLYKEGSKIATAYKNGVKIYESSTEPDVDYYLTFRFISGTGSITPNWTYNPTGATIEANIDGGGWNIITAQQVLTGSKIMFRGVGRTGGDARLFNTAGGGSWVISAPCKVSGNINTILDYNIPPTTLAAFAYCRMFQDCINLITAPELPATTIVGTQCYYSMFQGCTSLTTAPDLPATTLNQYCYSSMFRGCTSLTTAPDLPATTLAGYCYNGMFFGCTSLNYIEVNFSAYTPTTATTNWVSDIDGSGEFHCPAALPNTTGPNAMPTNFTRIEDVV